MNKFPKYVSFLKENRTKQQAKEIFEQRIKDSEEIFEKFSKQFIRRDCPVCGFTQHDELENFNGQYGVASCLKCSTMFVNPSPNLEALDYYYNNCKCNQQLGNLYNSRASKKGLILSERAVFVLELIKQQLHQKSKVRVLEVGCNSGGFLQEIKDALVKEKFADKVSLVGIDIDENAIKSPVDTDLTLYHSSAEDFVKKSRQSFDLVLHFELIEHLHNPFDFCCAIYQLLDKEGLMYFHTPNALGFENQVMSYNDFRPIAHGIFPPMHLNAFTTQNVGHFLIRCGFCIRSIETPGNFDVDMVRHFAKKENKLSIVNEIKEEKDLAIIQYLIRNLGASSHLAVLAAK